ncbi:MAG TPA: sorbosone dehydrogenase family protein [Trichocoleus sp.]|jgi:glucose/arabinose dehydrogenase
MRFDRLTRSLILSVLTGFAVVACSIASEPTQPTNQSPSVAASPAIVAQSPTNQPTKNLIRTQTLTPEKYQIRLNDLPQPFASDSASKPPQVLPIPQNPVLNVPAGFEVNVYAEGLDRPRWLALTPTGEVLVTETRQNQIRMLSDRDGDGVAEVNQVFATAENGLNQPFGMAFAENSFFLGNTNAVLRFPYQQGQTTITGRGNKIADLPADGYNNHWTRNVVAAPDGRKLYVSIGSASNVDEEPLPRASVQVMNLDGSDRQTFASGLRNPVGLDFHPLTGELYTAVNERDGLGDDLVPDYLTHLQSGEFYGWPYTYLASAKLDPRRLVDGRPAKPDLVAQTKTPDVLFQAHSAALGLQFYDGNTFPERYRNGAFVAFRGSWNRNQGTGYKVVFVPFDAKINRPAGSYEDFVTGFLTQPTVPATWGRPVGLLTLPDGSLLFTEEANGRIYRVQYRGNAG